jgi:hypothetical protein
MRVIWPSVLVSLIAVGAVACSGDRAPMPTGATTAAEGVSGGGSPPAAAEADCQFSRGVTTCTTTRQHVETSTHAEISGCMTFNGSEFVPGRRTRTFNDQTPVSETTVTLEHGRHGRVFDTSTSTTRGAVTPTLVSDECVAI